MVTSVTVHQAGLVIDAVWRSMNAALTLVKIMLPAM